MRRLRSGRPAPENADRSLRFSRRGALRIGGAGVAAALAGSTAAAGQTPDADSDPAGDGAFSPERRLALTETVLGALAAHAAPGAVAGVWAPGGASWTLAAGIGDLKTAAPMRLDDHVRIASITKTFVATVVLQLVDEGTLALDNRLATFVAGIPNGDEITIRQLLNMSAGVYNFINDPLIAVDYDRDPLLPFAPEQAIEIVRAHGEADFAPGAMSAYSDSNYFLLGVIVEQVAGRRVADEIVARIITPLGLAQTSFPSTPDLPEPYAHGYAPAEAGAGPGTPLRDVTRSNPDVAWTAGAMISTLHDLRTWVEALAAGALLSPGSQAERLAIMPWPAGPLSVGYGLGVLELGGLLGHNGGILGYGSWMFTDPASGTTLVVVVNYGSTTGDAASTAVFGGIADLLFPGRGFALLASAGAATPTPGATPTA